MKILHLSTNDISGGAARAAFRLHKGLQSIGVDSQMLVQFKSGDDISVIAPASKCVKGVSLLRPTLDALPLNFYSGWNGLRLSLAYLPEDLAGKCATINPDIVHLHWVADGFLRIETLHRFRKPLVWTLHDMWAFTGGCHYDEACGGYRESCGACPQLKSKKQMDLSHWVWKRKKKAWQGLDMTIVTPSRWLAECVQHSSLFRNHHVEVIPNGLDIKRYKPANKKLVRDMLGLPQDKKLILFGAIDAFSDKRKGFQFLKPALQNLAQNGWSNRVEVIVFGASAPLNPHDFGFPIHCAGHLYDDYSLVLLYSAADVMLVPSIQEAFGQTASEAMSCGTPVVTFDVTGLKDIVDHKINGYLAKAKNLNDLADGIQWVLADPERCVHLGKAAREKAVKEYALEVQAQRYLDLYEEILEKHTNRDI